VQDVQAAAERWSLAVGEPFDQGVGGHTTRATLADGTPAVLKLVHRHRESVHEADALRVWDGDGAIRLLAQNRDALLLERCEPGTPLSAAGQDGALDVLVELLPRLWRPAGEPFHTLADEAACWLPQLPRTRLGDAARAAIESLAGTQGEQVLLHQDLHGDNVLAAERERWLVIDPKPLAGEREFAVAPIVRSRELGATKRDVLYRFEKLTTELGLDRERARGWTIAQTVAWSNGAWHDSVAEWLLP
jgi:streptomycin 6-kinase